MIFCEAAGFQSQNQTYEASFVIIFPSMLFSRMIKSSIVYQDSSRHEPEPPLGKDNSNI